MNPSIRRCCSNHSANTVWHLDTTHELIKENCFVSEMIDGHSTIIFWLKCANNNIVDTNYQCFLKDINEHVCPFQVRGDKLTKNRLFAKHVSIFKKNFIQRLHR